MKNIILLVAGIVIAVLVGYLPTQTTTGNCVGTSCTTNGYFYNENSKTMEYTSVTIDLGGRRAVE